MNTLFQKRREQFTRQCLKYLRYVLNDHFVLVLLVFLGFILFQYKQLLANLPQERWLLLLGLVLIMGLFLSLGGVASFILPADKVFLLPQEEAVRKQLASASRRSFLVWGLLQIGLLIFLTPLLVALGLSWLLVLGLLLVLLILRWYLTKAKEARFLAGDKLDWNKLVVEEQERQQAILKFFALFTTVKGISSRTKPRSYLNFMVNKLPKSQDKLWLNLYVRAFLRSGDYLALSLRLLGMSFLILLFIQEVWLAVGLTLLLNYLLLFQLLALYHHYDYQYLTQLYPAPSHLKSKNLLLFLRYLGFVMLLGQSLLTWSGLGLALLWGGMLVILYLYLPYKLKQMID